MSDQTPSPGSGWVNDLSRDLNRPAPVPSAPSGTDEEWVSPETCGWPNPLAPPAPSSDEADEWRCVVARTPFSRCTKENPHDSCAVSPVTGDGPARLWRCSTGEVREKPCGYGDLACGWIDASPAAPAVEVEPGPTPDEVLAALGITDRKEFHRLYVMDPDIKAAATMLRQLMLLKQKQHSDE